MSNYYNRQWRLPNAERTESKLISFKLFYGFDGSSQYIDIDSSSFGSDSFSISLWFKQDTGTGFQGLFAGSGYDGGTGLIIYTYLNTVKIYTAVSGSTTNILTSTTFSFDTWYHVILKREYNVGWSLYIDGTEVNTYSSLTTTDLTSANTRIGKHYTSGLYFNGQIDGVAIFNYALSSSQVTTLYGSSSTGIGNPMSLSPKPISYYNLGDKSAFNGANYLVPNIAVEEADGDIATSYSPYALDFDGTNDYIDCGNDSSLNISGDLTLSIWVYLESDLTFNMVISKTIDANYRNYNFTIRPTTRTITFYTNNGTYENTTTSLSVDLNTWTNIVISCESGVTNGTKFYFNNVLDTTTGTHTITGETSDLYFGVTKFTGSFANYFDGKLSNASIWNTNLTSAQVSEIYNEGVPSNLNNHSAYSSLVSWWQLGSNSSFNTNWTVLDEKGSNNGTSVNMTEADIVDGVNSYANGTSSGMGGDEVIGDAPYSSSNSLSVNMDVEDRTTDTPS